MFDNKKIFILGMARSGYEAALILSKNNEVLVTDRCEQESSKVEELNKLGVKVVICDDPINLLDETYDYVVKNPGIKLDHPIVVKANKLNIPVINEVEVITYPKKINSIFFETITCLSLSLVNKNIKNIF